MLNVFVRPATGGLSFLAREKPALCYAAWTSSANFLRA